LRHDGPERGDLEETTMPDTATIETAAASRATAPVRLGGLDHVVLRVGDLDRAISFYRHVLGCEVERELQQPRLVQLRAGASLIDLVPASVSPHTAADKAGRNMDHFCVQVIGFDAAAIRAHLQQNGVDPGEVHERYGAQGYGPSIYISDPDGNTVELKGEATRGL
jgi:catechol 2,3-dioxygenase-like lactoylglutathione lyase family enzyme